MGDEKIINLEAARKKRERLRAAEADWATIARRLTAYASRVCRRRPWSGEPEDLAQEAIRHFFEHIDAWDPSERTLDEQLRSVLNGIAIDAARRGPNRRRKGATAEPTVGEATPREEDSDFYEVTPQKEIDDYDTGQAIENADLAKVTLAKIERACEGDLVALAVLAVLAAFAEGYDTPTEQARFTGQPLASILDARRRVERRARIARSQLEAQARIAATRDPNE